MCSRGWIRPLVLTGNCEAVGVGDDRRRGTSRLNLYLAPGAAGVADIGVEAGEHLLLKLLYLDIDHAGRQAERHETNPTGHMVRIERHLTTRIEIVRRRGSVPIGPGNPVFGFLDNQPDLGSRGERDQLLDRKPQLVRWRRVRYDASQAVPTVRGVLFSDIVRSHAGRRDGHRVGLPVWGLLLEYCHPLVGSEAASNRSTRRDVAHRNNPSSRVLKAWSVGNASDEPPVLHERLPDSAIGSPQLGTRNGLQ